MVTRTSNIPMHMPCVLSSMYLPMAACLEGSGPLPSKLVPCRTNFQELVVYGALLETNWQHVVRISRGVLLRFRYKQRLLLQTRSGCGLRPHVTEFKRLLNGSIPSPTARSIDCTKRPCLVSSSCCRQGWLGRKITTIPVILHIYPKPD